MKYLGWALIQSLVSLSKKGIFAHVDTTDSCAQKRPDEDAVRRELSASQRERLHKKTTLLTC
jgi:hypothetical protein